MRKLFILGGVAAFALAGAAAAQQAGDHPLRADADGDGRISQAEFVARHAERLQAMDADRNGVVTAAERTAARDARQAERADRRFARLDANSDGAISRAEFDAAAEHRRESRGERRHGRHGSHGATAGEVTIADMQARMAERFARLDADGDGFVTSEERRATMGQRRGHRGHHPASPAAE